MEKYREKNLQHLKGLDNQKDIDKYFGDQAQFYAAKQRLEQITNFNGDFDFLNNEFECEIYFEGLFYPNVYNAYQAARTTSQFYRKKFTESLSSYEIYELSNQIDNPENWDANRLIVMEQLLRDKFLRHKELTQKLVETGNRQMLNSYSDKTVSNLYWGVVGNEGENHLGKLLMAIRADIVTGKDLEKWISSQIKLSADVRLQPDYIIEVFKEDQRIEVHELSKKFYYVFGSSSESDVQMPNPSISRKHCLIAFDAKVGLVLVDLNSTWGTLTQAGEIPKLVPVPLNNQAEFRCGNSARTYKITMRFERMQEALERKSQKLDYDIKILQLTKDDGVNRKAIDKNDLKEKTSDTLFVTGFEGKVTEDDLEAVFSEFGRIREIRIPVERYSGLSKGFAFVQFDEEESTRAALKSTGVYLNDKRLIIKIAEKKKSEMYNSLKKTVENKKLDKHIRRHEQESRRKKRKDSSSRSRSSSAEKPKTKKRHARSDSDSDRIRKRRRSVSSSSSYDSSSDNRSSSRSQYSSESRSKTPKKRHIRNKKYSESSSVSSSDSYRRRRPSPKKARNHR